MTKKLLHYFLGNPRTLFAEHSNTGLRRNFLSTKILFLHFLQFKLSHNLHHLSSIPRKVKHGVPLCNIKSYPCAYKPCHTYGE
jgi:hypothetical protein